MFTRFLFFCRFSEYSLSFPNYLFDFGPPPLCDEDLNELNSFKKFTKRNKRKPLRDIKKTTVCS